jgi:hypothetical protein
MPNIRRHANKNLLRISKNPEYIIRKAAQMEAAIAATPQPQPLRPTPEPKETPVPKKRKQRRKKAKPTASCIVGDVTVSFN